MGLIRKHSLLVVLVAIATLPLRAIAQMPVARVVLSEARIVEASPTITLVGTVEPVRRSRVSAELAGLIVDMPVREGDRVTAGKMICTLNDDTLSLRLAGEKAQLGALRSRHEELLAGTRKGELVRLEARFDEASAEFDRSKFEMQRIERLYADRDSNDKEYQDARADFLASERRKIAAEAEFKLGVEGPRKETIAQAAHDVARQQAVVDRLASDVRKTVIRTPFAGHIVARLVEVGEWISEGDPVVEIVDLSSVLVRVNVPEHVLPHLRIGHSVRVMIDALERTLSGRIKHIMRQADRNARTFPVQIELDNTEETLAGGMFARATVPAGPTADVLAVPSDAVVEREGIAYVGVVMPGHQGGHAGVLLPVTLGMNVGDWVTITSDNLSPGTRVIIRGTERILPFPTPVEIVDDRGTPVAMPDGGRKKAPAGDA